MQRAPGNPGLHQGAETNRTTGWLAQQFFAAQDYETTNPATIDWNVAAQQVRLIQLNANTTITFPTNIRRGASYVLFVKQDGTGSRTLTWSNQAAGLGSGTWKWSGGSAPTLTTTASKIDVITFMCDGTHMFGNAVLNF